MVKLNQFQAEILSAAKSFFPLIDGVFEYSITGNIWPVNREVDHGSYVVTKCSPRDCEPIPEELWPKGSHVVAAAKGLSFLGCKTGCIEFNDALIVYAIREESFVVVLLTNDGEVRIVCDNDPSDKVWGQCSCKNLSQSRASKLISMATYQQRYDNKECKIVCKEAKELHSAARQFGSAFIKL